MISRSSAGLVQLVAPDDQRLEGKRALTEPGNHRFAAGLDTLGDGDFAFAREKLHGAHLAQIHAHRIVGAIGRLLLLAGCKCGAASRREFAAFAFALVGAVIVVAGGSLLGFLSSMTLMPMSESMDIVSSICSEVTSSEGRTELSSSMVT